MDIIINGYFGWNNMGDEAALQGILQHLQDHKITLGTSLPYQLFKNYKIGYPIVNSNDLFGEYDIHIGGVAGAGFDASMRQFSIAKSKNKKTMLYGTGLIDLDFLNYEKIASFLYEYLNLFDSITTRSLYTKEILDDLGITSTLTMDPGINLKEEKWNCPQNKIICAPRFPDSSSPNFILEKFIKYLRPIKDEVILVPFAAYNDQGHPVDMYMCDKIKEHLGCPIYNFHPFLEVKKCKYLFSQSKKLITNGRLHAIIFAIAHNLDIEFIEGEKYQKFEDLFKMHKKFTLEQLKKMECKNFALLEQLLEEAQRNF